MSEPVIDMIRANTLRVLEHAREEALVDGRLRVLTGEQIATEKSVPRG